MVSLYLHSLSCDILKSRNKCKGAVLGNQDGGYLTMFLSRIFFFFSLFYYVIYLLYISNEKSEKSYFYIFFTVKQWLKLVILEELVSKIFSPTHGGGHY